MKNKYPIISVFAENVKCYFLDKNDEGLQYFASECITDIGGNIVEYTDDFVSFYNKIIDYSIDFMNNIGIEKYKYRKNRYLKLWIKNDKFNSEMLQYIADRMNIDIYIRMVDNSDIENQINILCKSYLNWSKSENY